MRILHVFWEYFEWMLKIVMPANPYVSLKICSCYCCFICVSPCWYLILQFAFYFSESLFASLWFVHFILWLSYIFSCNMQYLIIFSVSVYSGVATQYLVGYYTGFWRDVWWRYGLFTLWIFPDLRSVKYIDNRAW